MKKNNLGFTLIELMVAMAIIALLAAVLLVNMQGYGKDARASKALAQASSAIPEMLSCAGNGGTPIFTGPICSGISGAASYGSWQVPNGYQLNAANWTSSSNWYFSYNSVADSQTICCNSTMNSCAVVSVSCNTSVTW